MIQVKWVSPHSLFDTKDDLVKEVSVIPLSALTEVVEGLRVIGMETYCDGPGCGWCEDGNRHPFTENAKEAQRLLAMLEEGK